MKKLFIFVVLYSQALFSSQLLNNDVNGYPVEVSFIDEYGKEMVRYFLMVPDNSITGSDFEHDEMAEFVESLKEPHKKKCKMGEKKISDLLRKRKKELLYESKRKKKKDRRRSF